MLYHFLQKDSGIVRGRLLFMLLVSGASTGILVSVMNAAVMQLAAEHTDLRLLLLYALVFMLYVYSQKYSLEYSIYRMESALYALRMRIVTKLANSPLSRQEDLAEKGMNNYLSSEVDLTGQLLPWISYSAQAMSILLFCLIYLAWISVAGFLVLLFMLVSAVLWHLFVEVQSHHELRSLYQEERHFSSIMRGLTVHAFKIRLNHLARDDLLQRCDGVAQKSKKIRLSIDQQVIRSVMSTRIAIFLLLAVFIFVLPLLNESDAETILKISIAAFFVVTASAQLVYGIPYLLRLNLALSNIYQLEQQLAPMAVTPEDLVRGEGALTIGSFSSPGHAVQHLQVEGVRFSYPQGRYNNEPFSLALPNLNVHGGELVMVHGPSGSGKTTFLKVLSALYHPVAGSIKVDDQPIFGPGEDSYRELFALVTADTHPGHRLYCDMHPDNMLVYEWLKKVGLDADVYYQNEWFFYDQLPASKKYRLAMIIAFLEDKSIILLDDLDAFQDSGFLGHFYTTIVPELTRRGKILFVSTRNKDSLNYANQVISLAQSNESI